MVVQRRAVRRAAVLAGTALLLVSVLAAVAPAAGAAGPPARTPSDSGPSSVGGSCGDGVHEEVHAAGSQVASIHVAPSQSCGASYDRSTNQLDLIVAFDALEFRVFVPVAGLGSPGSNSIVDHLPSEVGAESDPLVDLLVGTARGATGDVAAPVWQAWDDSGARQMMPTLSAVVHIHDVEVGALPVEMGPGAPPVRPVHAPTHGVRPASAAADAGHGGPAAPTGEDPTAFGAEVVRVLVLPDQPVRVAALAVIGLLSLIGAVALYRRLRAGRVLDHPLRSRVYDHIKAHPGITTQELSDRLGVDYSTARHHADVLVEFDLVHTRRDGRIRHLFENHGTYGTFEKRAIPLLREGTSARIARLVHDHPGIRPTDVARRLEVDPSTVKWHLDKLREAELVDAEPLDGRSFGLVVPDAARDVVGRWA